MAEIAELHPSEFTKSETAIKALKRKRWFGLLSTEGLKEAHFDPTPLPTDHTIDKYHKRIRTQLPEDRQKLHFSIPFEGQLNSTMDILEKLQSEMVKTQSEMAKTQSEMAKTQSEMAKTQSEIEEMKKKHESDTAEMKKKHENDIAELKNKARADKLMLFFGNMLITLARRLAKQYKPAITDDPCTSKLQQFVMSIKDTQLREAGVPTKIWPFLRDFHKYVSERNEQAHESAQAFANLLREMANIYPDILDQWKGCFEFVYGVSVEEMAKEGKEDEEEKQKSWNRVFRVKD